MSDSDQSLGVGRKPVWRRFPWSVFEDNGTFSCWKTGGAKHDGASAVRLSHGHADVAGARAWIKENRRGRK